MWLIKQDAFAPIAAAIKQCVQPTEAQLAQFNAEYMDGGDFPGSRIMVKAGSTAQINITGVLSKEPSWMLRFFGGGNTAYSEIISAIAEAERDANILNVIFAIDSPGGQTSGLTEAMDAINALKKPSEAVVVGMACSAAYGLASQAGRIVAANRGVMVGSLGVKGTFYVDPEEIEVTSTNAPNKAPDVTTTEGQAQVRELLDQIEAVFFEDIADGRNVTVDTIKSNYGQGATFLAKEALSRAMIDAIDEKPRTQPKPGAVQPSPQGANSMNLQELKAQHPGVYAEALAEGVKQERDRVCAHATMGEASGDIKTAIGAIKDGSEMTATLQATYMAANMRNAQIGARAADNQPTIDALGGVTPQAKADDDAAFNAALAANLGVKVNG